MKKRSSSWLIKTFDEARKNILFGKKDDGSTSVLSFKRTLVKTTMTSTKSTRAPFRSFCTSRAVFDRSIAEELSNQHPENLANGLHHNITEEQLLSLKRKMVDELQELRLTEMRIRDEHADARRREEQAAIDHLLQEHQKGVLELKEVVRKESSEMLKILTRRTLLMFTGWSFTVVLSTLMSIQVIVNGGSI
jgi:hypothetical protein